MAYDVDRNILEGSYALWTQAHNTPCFFVLLYFLYCEFTCVLTDGTLIWHLLLCFVLVRLSNPCMRTLRYLLNLHNHFLWFKDWRKNWGICLCFLSLALPISSKNFPLQALCIYFFHLRIPLPLWFSGSQNPTDRTKFHLPPIVISLFYWCLFFPLPLSFPFSPETMSLHTAYVDFPYCIHELYELLFEMALL